MNAPQSRQPRFFQRPKFWAMATALTIFPLIWMGGLVTTHDAGMAVPDWPGTYGYNLLLYPVSTWLYGPFDLFVEHGHRLLGALAGFLAIALVISTFTSGASRQIKLWSIGLLVAIILQGALGGIRVLQTNRVMAMVHGCTGPMVFALAAYVALLARRGATAVVDAASVPSNLSANKLSQPQNEKGTFNGRGTSRFAWLVTCLAMLQLIVGAGLRHLNVNLKPVQFMGLTHLHLTIAVLLTLGVCVQFLLAARSRKKVVSLLPRKLPGILLLLIAIQILLGCLTWYVNYALPWSTLSRTLSAHVNHLKGIWETTIVTAHQAVGSLILLTAFLVSVRASEAAAQPIQST